MKRLVAGEEGGEGEIERKKTIETRGGEEFASFLIPLCHRRIRRQSPFSRLFSIPFIFAPSPFGRSSSTFVFLEILGVRGALLPPP